ncbi:DUF3891 family protein [Rudanella paleaurantiibacter]|uniref:DUF3891 family protein n=1 Tax=Rudanella paleaurantiibacter TaxID=2614655 RepID=A0A7J5U3P6_9BACT|nr:DUF3891 family protein [Rudanella paleaurantiibacter]KAB7732462.1 DUF3891 family protein [Rudanella paleaurantiibacter]
MIVTNTNTGWRVIHQQAHGLLAMQLALHWKPQNRPARWHETLAALLEHDDGQDAWEGRNHLTDAGAPLDFHELEYSVEQMKNMIRIGLEKSRWNALMLSMHTTFLYTEKRGEDRALDEFLDQQKTNQTKWRKTYGATVAEARYAYDFLQWCDALSLVLCQDLLQIEERRLEVSKGPDQIPYFIYQRTDGSVGLEPWPFATREFTVHVESYLLTQLAFTDDTELYNALNDAEVEELSWTFRQ